MPARSDPPAGRVAPWVEELVDSGEAMGFVKACKAQPKGTLPTISESELNWSNHGFSNYFFQSLSLANLKAYYYTTAAALLHS